ncbi:MAG TPA: tRNA 4-thiouridine(8) synthase ThiI, partial [Firmicutes bacterium]|nr:tRNA 4-thiouridine(8) synthase ThiI [Bacillota bacterium]
MKNAYFLIHYGELGTKGGNRRLFIKELAKNIRHSIKGFPHASLTYDHDHAYVEIGDEDEQLLLKRLMDVSGIQKISLVKKCERDFDAVLENALSLIKEETGKTFKVITKRADKLYPLDSMEISRKVGGYILKNTTLEVDVHDPDIALHIDLRKDFAYLYAHSYPGAGGYPLGMNGKVMMMLSGGIDSPVASYLLLRRGIRIECIHFAAPPYTSDAVLDKLKDILKVLSHYQSEIKLQ